MHESRAHATVNESSELGYPKFSYNILCEHLCIELEMFFDTAFRENLNFVQLHCLNVIAKPYENIRFIRYLLVNF